MILTKKATEQQQQKTPTTKDISFVQRGQFILHH